MPKEIISMNQFMRSDHYVVVHWKLYCLEKKKLDSETWPHQRCPVPVFFMKLSSALSLRTGVCFFSLFKWTTNTTDTTKFSRCPLSLQDPAWKDTNSTPSFWGEASYPSKK